MSILRDWIRRQNIGRGDDIKEMGVRLANDSDAMVGRQEALSPGDPEAEDVLRAASDLLQVLTVTYGPIAGWTLAQHHLIFRTANRVFGADQRVVTKPNWSESH